MPISGKIVSVRKNGDGLEGLFKNSRAALVKVGFLAGLGSHPKGKGDATIIEIGWWNEFGVMTKDGKVRVPARPFVRPTIRMHQKDYLERMRLLIIQVLLGKMKPEKAAAVLGLRVQRDMQNFIVELSEPANADLTVEAKGSSSPLIDTATMKNSIHWAIWK